MGSQCFDEDDRGNWSDCWYYGTRVGTQVGHMGPGYPSTRVLTSLVKGDRRRLLRNYVGVRHHPEHTPSNPATTVNDRSVDCRS